MFISLSTQQVRLFTQEVYYVVLVSSEERNVKIENFILSFILK
jgi:hypothetical protein